MQLLSKAGLSVGGSVISNEDEHWIAAFSDLAVQSLDSRNGCEPAILRQAHALFNAWSGIEGFRLDHGPSKVELQRLIDCGAFESAAIRLIGPHLGWMLSRSSNGVCITTVSFATADVTFEASSSSLGLVAAAATLAARRLERAESRPDHVLTLH